MDVSGGFTVWLTGLSGAGKSTLARGVRRRLQALGQRVELLDGDELRASISRDLGFSRADRDTHVRRIGLMAQMLARNGVATLVAAISPYREVRDEIRRAHPEPFVEVFVDCRLDELVRRDTKGLYARALRGDIQHFTGVSDPYEPPLFPEIHLRSDEEREQESVAKILRWLEERGLIQPAP
jgi:adenylyl-sulfate kinase